MNENTDVINEKFDFSLVFPKSDYDKERKFLESEFKDSITIKKDTDELKRDPFLLVISVSLLVISKIVSYQLKKREKGVLIDTRESPPEITTLRNVPQGTIVTVSNDGVEVDYPLNKDDNKLEKKILEIIKEIL